MKIIKIGQCNFWPLNNDEAGKWRAALVIDYLNKFSNKYKYQYADCFNEDCDIVFYSLYQDINNLKKCKGNPIFIYWTDELSCGGNNWCELNGKSPYDFYRQNNLSISFYDDSDYNCYFPYGILFYDDIIRTKLNYDNHFNKTKFCTFCASNDVFYNAKYRTEFVKYINNNYKEVTCCGKVLNNTNNVYLSFNLDEAREYHNEYKFNLCFENESSDGDCKYITEKIFNAFIYNVVPIYWGSYHINDIFNKEAFINCNGLSYEESLNKIIEVDDDDELYDYMINQWPFKYKSINYKDYFFEKLYKFVEKIFL